MAILIMLNNYFHDLAVAILFVNVVLTWLYIKIFAQNLDRENLKYFIRFSLYLTYFSLFLILLLGVPRAIFYKRYEWMEAAGRGQVTALIVKHVILALLTFSAILLQMKIKRRFYGD